MNIIEAREAAMAGKTVITPNGIELVHYGFGDMEMISREWVFGEWKIKEEPVVFETRVEVALMGKCGKLQGVAVEALYSLINKNVRVTVEVLP